MVSLVSTNYLIENTLLRLQLNSYPILMKELLQEYRNGKAAFQFTVHFGEVYLLLASKGDFSRRYYIKFNFGVSNVRERATIFDYRPILAQFLAGNLSIKEEDFIHLGQVWTIGEVLQARRELADVNIPATKDFVFDWQVSSEGFVSVEGISSYYGLKLSVVTLNLLIIAWRRQDEEKHKENAKRLKRAKSL